MNNGDNGTSGQLDPKLHAPSRELTREERAAIRMLVKGLCANYDREYGCLPLWGDCYMLHKWWTGSYCRYFTRAVLPAAPALEAMLTGGAAVETRFCRICGEAFPADGKQAYCSDACATEAKKRQQRGYMRERRGNC